MATIRFLLPEATRNYIKNPSFRYVADGWTATGASISRTLEQARFNVASLKIVAAGSVIGEGAYYRVSALAGVSDDATASLYVRGVGAVRVRLTDNASGMEWASKSIALRSDRWQRIEVSGRCSGGDDVRLYVETADRVQAVTFYADGAQIERHPYATTFCDGDQPDCRWNIVAHDSEASRDVYTRQGGRWENISEKCERKNLYVTVIGGAGMAPIVNNTQSYAMNPGSYFDNMKVESRVITMSFHAKNEDLQNKKERTLRYLHELRQNLLDTIKPDRTGRGQPFLMEYQDGEIPVYLWVRYDGGMEGSWDIRNRWVNSFPVRLLATSPYYSEDSHEVALLSFTESLGLLQETAGRQEGQWSNLNYGVNNVLSDMAVDSSGRIYIAGSFTVINNNALAIDPLRPALDIAYWDGEKWNSIGITSVGGTGAIYAVAISPNGNIYIGGIFTSINGVAANNIAYYDGTWHAMGVGVNDTVRDIAVAPNGDVYVAGEFTTAGGGTAAYIARYRVSGWSGIGAYNGLNDTVYSVAISRDGSKIYLGGIFQDENTSPGGSLKYIAQYDTATNAFSQMGSGMNQDVFKIIVSSSNTVYAVGAFTLAGGASCLRIASWNGSAWSPLGSGLNASAYALAEAANGLIYVAGGFTASGNFAIQRLAAWNGFTWISPDVVVAGLSASIKAVVTNQNGDIYIVGFSLSSASKQSSCAAINLVENIGTAEVSPIIYVHGYGKLRWVENQTNGKIVYLDAEILSNEDVFIDFGAGTIKSDLRGNIPYVVLPGSDFSDFTLSPGENKIAIFMTNDVGGIIQIGYTPRHWSADATVVNGEL